MRIKFRRVLDELNEALLKLGDLVIEQFEKSEKVLRTKDSELAKLIIENDDNNIKTNRNFGLLHQ